MNSEDNRDRWLLPKYWRRRGAMFAIALIEWSRSMRRAPEASSRRVMLLRMMMDWVDDRTARLSREGDGQ